MPVDINTSTASLAALSFTLGVIGIPFFSFSKNQSLPGGSILAIDDFHFYRTHAALPASLTIRKCSSIQTTQ
jgi:hypothetical protein